MIKFMKRLWKDRRGNAILIAGAAMPLVVGAAGLATDTIQWTLWKRELQRAADSAAFAGVYALAQNASASSAVAADLGKNNKTGIALKTGYSSCGGTCQIAFPTSANWTNGVQVTIAIQKTLGFSSLFISTAPTIVASGTAAMVDDGTYCLVALKKSGGAGITLGGSALANMGCGGISNSNANPAVSTNGGSYTFTAPVLAGVGTLPTSVNGVSELQPHHMALPDPFANKYPTTVPSGTNCTNFQQKLTNLGTGNNKDYHLAPGCYNSFQITGNETYTMDPGVYYLNSTDFDLGGTATIKGTGVTIILTGTTPGSIKTNGNAGIQLTAPTTGTYSKMLFIQSGSATTDNVNEINGNSASFYDGAIYTPKGNITFTGSSGAMTKCAMVVGYTVAFSGNTNLQNNTIGCSANQTVTAKQVRLVA